MNHKLKLFPLIIKQNMIPKINEIRKFPIRPQRRDFHYNERALLFVYNITAEYTRKDPQSEQGGIGGGKRLTGPSLQRKTRARGAPARGSGRNAKGLRGRAKVGLNRNWDGERDGFELCMFECESVNMCVCVCTCE